MVVAAGSGSQGKDKAYGQLSGCPAGSMLQQWELLDLRAPIPDGSKWNR